MMRRSPVKYLRRSPVKYMSKVQHCFVELRHCIWPYLRTSKCLGHSVLQTAPLVFLLFPTTTKKKKKETTKFCVKIRFKI